MSDTQVPGARPAGGGVYFSLPLMPSRDAWRLVLALSQAHASAAYTGHPAARGLIEVRVQRVGPSARVFLSGAVLRIAAQYGLCATLEEQHAERELPAGALVMLKYEPTFTTPPAMQAIENERVQSA